MSTSGMTMTCVLAPKPTISRPQQRDRDDRLVVPDGSGLLDAADQEEVGVVAVGAGEVRAGLQQQRVARPEHDVADAALQAGAAAVDGHDGGVVQGAEVRVADASCR